MLYLSRASGADCVGQFGKVLKYSCHLAAIMWVQWSSWQSIGNVTKRLRVRLTPSPLQATLSKLLTYCVLRPTQPPCPPWSCLWLYRPQWSYEGRYQWLNLVWMPVLQIPEHQGETVWADLVKCWSTPATLQQQGECSGPVGRLSDT